MAVRDLHVINP